MTRLRNLVNKNELKEKIQKENISRTTLSFYRYVKISEPQNLRDTLFTEWKELNVLGRTYLAQEGINAQISVPKENWKKFVEKLYAHKEFEDIPFKIAVEEKDYSFYRLTIKVKDKIVADGLNDEFFDPSKVGTHLSAEEFNQFLENEDSIVIDVRNHYESEVGHFESAICPDADTFREELPMIEKIAKENSEKKILLYCTGGIRCEKTSAYLKHIGHEKVYQLKGGIIQYKKEIEEKGLKSKFKGKNFVFDERMGERITNDIISKCHQCGEKCDDHTNCKNDACHLLFIQCKNCSEKYSGCCTPKCQEIASLPIEEQKKIRKSNKNEDSLAVYKSRLRPKLNELIANS